jgi:hypothetical protein
MPVHQHFSVVAGDDVELVFDIDLNDEITLQDANLVVFELFEQQYGVVTNTDPVITRHSSSGNGGVTILSSPSNRLIVLLSKDLTTGYLRNYYFELKVVDVNDNNSTVANGVMTFIEAIIPPVTTP